MARPQGPSTGHLPAFPCGFPSGLISHIGIHVLLWETRSKATCGFALSSRMDSKYCSQQLAQSRYSPKPPPKPWPPLKPVLSSSYQIIWARIAYRLESVVNSSLLFSSCEHVT